MALLSPFASSLCSCLETGANDILNQITGRLNKIVRDKTRLNNLLGRAPLSFTLPKLDLTLDTVIDFEKGLEDLTGKGFPFPGGGDISLGELTKCLKIDIDIVLDLNLVLDLNNLANAFCDLSRFTELAQNLVDDLIPKLDAQVGLGCDPAKAAFTRLVLENRLGEAGIDTSAESNVDNLIAPSAGQVGAEYSEKFGDLVKCCVNITKLRDGVKDFIKDPLSGDDFNVVQFNGSIFGAAKLGDQDLINTIDINDASALEVIEETLPFNVFGQEEPGQVPVNTGEDLL